MARIPVFRSGKIRKIVEEAVKQKKLIIIAQRETTRIVKPENPERVVFIAREET